MSIVRIGLAETKHFSEGYEAIFGKKTAKAEAPTKAKKAAGRGARKKGKKGKK